MLYTEHRPSQILKPFIECIWTLCGTLEAAPAQPERLLPDGCMELVFHRGTPFERAGERQGVAFLVGQMFEPAFVIMSRQVEVLGTRFQPGGASAFFDTSMRELANRFLDIQLVAGSFGRELEERVLHASTLTSAVQIAIRQLERRLKPLRPEGLRARGLAACQIQEHGNVPIRELAVKAGISERQLEREFGHFVGLTPKLFSRILRFQRVFTAIERESEWVDVALECGYYDQSHLIADFRRFSGSTPTAFDAERFELGRHFLRSSRMSGFSKTAEAGLS
jgi:AraC-like DNA-binding protein